MADISLANRRALGGLLFLEGAQYTVDVYSAVNSSPWTAEHFGASEQDEKSLRKYVYHAIVQAAFFNLIAAVIAGTAWPLLGMVLEDAYMYYLYHNAIQTSKAKTQSGWEAS